MFRNNLFGVMCIRISIVVAKVRAQVRNDPKEQDVLGQLLFSAGKVLFVIVRDDLSLFCFSILHPGLVVFFCRHTLECTDRHRPGGAGLYTGLMANDA